MRYIAIYVLLILSLVFVTPAMGDEPPPPPPHGTGGDWQPGGSAPIGNGTTFLVIMGAFYGLKQVYDRRRRLIE